MYKFKQLLYCFFTLILSFFCFSAFAYKVPTKVTLLVPSPVFTGGDGEIQKTLLETVGIVGPSRTKNGFLTPIKKNKIKGYGEPLTLTSTFMIQQNTSVHITLHASFRLYRDYLPIGNESTNTKLCLGMSQPQDMSSFPSYRQVYYNKPVLITAGKNTTISFSTLFQYHAQNDAYFGAPKSMVIQCHTEW